MLSFIEKLFVKAPCCMLLLLLLFVVDPVLEEKPMDVSCNVLRQDMKGSDDLCLLCPRSLTDMELSQTYIFMLL